MSSLNQLFFGGAFFRDRADAGAKLASCLDAYGRSPDLVVLGIPRGGVPVAAVVAHVLHAPLDVFLARKLGVPGQEELAFGAVSSGGVQVLEESTIGACGLSQATIERIATREAAEIQRRETVFRSGRPPLDLAGTTAILVDDGLATGASMRAAATALRLHKPARIVVAVPVAPLTAAKSLVPFADDFVCFRSVPAFGAVSRFYGNFLPVSDDEVKDLLTRAAAEAHAAADKR